MRPILPEKERLCNQITFGSSSPDDLRQLGFTVTVHNDYRLGGVAHTYWHLSDSKNQGYIGEGRSDADALDQIRHQIIV